MIANLFLEIKCCWLNCVAAVAGVEVVTCELSLLATPCTNEVCVDSSVKCEVDSCQLEGLHYHHNSLDCTL